MLRAQHLLCFRGKPISFQLRGVIGMWLRSLSLRQCQMAINTIRSRPEKIRWRNGIFTAWKLLPSVSVPSGMICLLISISDTAFSCSKRQRYLACHQAEAIPPNDGGLSQEKRAAGSVQPDAHNLAVCADTHWHPPGSYAGSHDDLWAV